MFDVLSIRSDGYSPRSSQGASQDLQAFSRGAKGTPAVRRDPLRSKSASPKMYFWRKRIATGCPIEQMVRVYNSHSEAVLLWERGTHTCPARLCPRRKSRLGQLNEGDYLITSPVTRYGNT